MKDRFGENTMQIKAEKQKILKAIDELPEQTTIEDAMERLYFLYKVEKGLKQADDGQKISHEEAKDKLKKWLE